MAIIYTAPTNKNTSGWWADNGSSIVNTNYPQGINASDGVGNSIEQYDGGSVFETIINQANSAFFPGGNQIRLTSDTVTNEESITLKVTDDLAYSNVNFAREIITRGRFEFQANNISDIMRNGVNMSMDANQTTSRYVVSTRNHGEDVVSMIFGHLNDESLFQILGKLSRVFGIKYTGEIMTNQVSLTVTPGSPIGQMPIYDELGTFIGHIRVYA